ncbi:MAG: hypothetical protein OIN87_01710 [Candidatus Methanoperedens sp.]|nr:hypothetical protein [Candidatus Methanoperedens sp.]
MYIDIRGQGVPIRGAAGDIDFEPAPGYDFIHLRLAAVAACGTPAVAGFRAVARTHTISAPGYRRRRFHDAATCPCNRIWKSKENTVNLENIYIKHLNMQESAKSFMLRTMDEIQWKSKRQTMREINNPFGNYIC